MRFTTHPIPVQARQPTALGAPVNPWLLWRPEAPDKPERLTIAETAECRCPDLCDRDHGND